MDHPGSRLLYAAKVFDLQMHVVKDKDHVTPLSRRRWRGRRLRGCELCLALICLDCFDRAAELNGESGDGALLAVIEDLEIFFLQAVDCSALLVADDDGHQNPVHFQLHGWSGGLRLACLLSGRTQTKRSQTTEKRERSKDD